MYSLDSTINWLIIVYSLLTVVCVRAEVHAKACEVVSVSVYLPQWVDIKQWWLQLCQLYGCDAHGPDVT